MNKKNMIFFLVTMLVLSGCSAAKTAPESPVPSPTEEPAMVLVSLPDGSEVGADTLSLCPRGNVGDDLPGWQAALSRLPALRELDLSESTLSAEELRTLQESCPAAIRYTPTVCGRELELSAQSLDLHALTGGEVSEYLPWLPLMTELKELELGEESEERALSWEDILALEQAAPQAVPHYRFQLFDRSVTLEDTTLDLNHRKMDDRGELVRRVVRCMPALETLDMDSCGVADEDMASIRDEFPDVKVVWRVFFGAQYTCRTDVEKILASWPAAGLIKDSNCSALRYCTEVKYLDIGHNTPLTDISFLSCMPKLEVCILYRLAYMTDISPLADCPHLEYLELNGCDGVKDLTPLRQLKELRHLNLCLVPMEDITCLYDLDLERLYLGFFTQVPQEQIEEIRRLHPDMEIDTTCCKYVGGNWRGEYVNGECILTERYELLKEQFGYRYPYDYALPDADPLYRAHE